jgi:hypothetical protein
MRALEINKNWFMTMMEGGANQDQAKQDSHIYTTDRLINWIQPSILSFSAFRVPAAMVEIMCTLLNMNVNMNESCRFCGSSLKQVNEVEAEFQGIKS